MRLLFFAIISLFILSAFSYFVLLAINNIIWGYKGISINDKEAPDYKKRKRSLKIISVPVSLVIVFMIGFFKTYDGKVNTPSGQSTSPTKDAPVSVVATLQDSEGMTDNDIDLDYLKRIEKWIVETSVKNARQTYAGTGNDPAKFNPYYISESQFVIVEGKKLGVIKVVMYPSKSDRTSAVRVVRIFGLTSKGMETVGCLKNSDDEIPIISGVCGNKIHEVFGVNF